MKTLHRALAACSVLLLAAGGLLLSGVRPFDGDERAVRRPADGLAGDEREDATHEERERAERQAWIEAMHRTPDGSDWRTIDARTRAALAPRRAAVRTALAAGGTHKARAVATLGGTWTERGSSNQSGRVVGSAYDPSSDRFFAFSHGGMVWSRARAGGAWTVHNDHDAFRPFRIAASFELLRRPGAPTRILASSAQADAVVYSDDGGATWRTSEGFTDDSFDIERIAVRNGGSGHVYVIRQEDSLARRLWVSTDGGARFAPGAFLGNGASASLFALRERSEDVFVLYENRLSRIDPSSHTLVAAGFVPPAPFARHTILTGGVAPDGRTFLYAAYEPGPGLDALVFRSLDGGLSWTRGADLPGGLFTPSSFASSTRDPDLVVGGNLELWRSTDGGQTWSRPSRFYDYYQNPATIPHADLPDVRTYDDAAGREHFLVSTDGGLFDSADGGVTFANLTLEFPSSQYYATLTEGIGDGMLLAGAQDQGLQKSARGAGRRFKQVYEGDYGPLASGDFGATAWTSYPGLVMRDAQASSEPGVFDSWYFGLHDATSSFLSHLSIAGHDPNVVWVGGATLPHAGILELRYVPGQGIVERKLPYEFNSVVRATATDAFDPNLRYAATDALIYRTRDAGETWELLDVFVAARSVWYGVLRTDPEVPGRAVVSGNAYAGYGVLELTDGGDRMRILAAGLPGTYVYDVAFASGTDALFAATEVGAFRWDEAADRWHDITGGAPDAQYWDVDWLEGPRVARFATFARGVWDFAVDASLDTGTPARQRALTGLWYDRDTAGQGLEFEVDPSSGFVFGSWFTYDAAPGGGGTERQRWYSLQGTIAPGADAVLLTIYRNEGGRFDAEPQTGAIAVGRATLHVGSCSESVFAYALENGPGGRMALSRLLPDVHCDAGGVPAAPAPAARDALLSGHWYSPGTLGQGVAVELNPVAGQLFVAWFTYANGDATDAFRQRWYTIQAPAAAAQRTFADAPVFETTGGVFGARGATQTRRVGTARVTFQSCSSASIDYTMQSGDAAGRTGRVALQRLVGTPAGCAP